MFVKIHVSVVNYDFVVYIMLHDQKTIGFCHRIALVGRKTN